MGIDKFIDDAIIVVERKDYNPKPNSEKVEKVKDVSCNVNGETVRLDKATIGNISSYEYEYDFVDCPDDHLSYLLQRSSEKTEPVLSDCFYDDWQEDFIIVDFQIMNPERRLQRLYRSICKTSGTVHVHVKTRDGGDIDSVPILKRVLEDEGLI